MRINAWAARKPGAELERFSYEKEVGRLDVLIATKYCSLTRGDLGFIDNFWGDSKYPLVPGCETFGVIEKTGIMVEDLRVGDYVGVGYQVFSCFQCEYCKIGKEQFCQKQKVIGVNEYGGLANHIIVDSHFVFKIPPKLRKLDYVPLLCSGLTVFSAIKKVNPKVGMKVGVVGVGNLGHLAVQMLDKMGCQVTAFSHSKEKEATLKKLGARYFVNSIDKEELEREARKYDLIFSTSTAPLDWPVYLKALKPQGNLCIIGLPAEEISFPAVLLADYAQRGILGSYIGSRAEMRELLDFAARHNIKAIVQAFPGEETNNVVSKMRNQEIPFSAVIKLK